MKTVIKNIILIALVVIAGIVVYSVFFKKDAAPDTGLVQTGVIEETGDTGVGREFLTTLLSIRSIRLDESIFSNKTFKSLQDFTRPIPPDTDPGRSNPFAPLGADSAAVSTQVSTSNPSSIGPTSSTLNGTLSVSGPQVMRWFEYGTTSSLGTQTAPKAQGAPGAFAESVTGLAPNTTYFVKAVASIGGTTVAGNLVTWKTALRPN